VTAPSAWPSFGRKTGAKVDYQVAAPTELGTPTMHRAKSLNQECGWKDGDRGGLARMQGIHRRKEKTHS
jgi:hypothetical protein